MTVEKTVANIIRRVINVKKTMYDLINDKFQETIGIREQIRQQEEALAIKRERIKLAKRCSVYIREKMMVSKKAVFKRQNSFDM